MLCKKIAIALLYTLFIFITLFNISHASGYSDIFDLAKQIVYGKNKNEISDGFQTTKVEIEEKVNDVVSKNNVKKAMKFFGVKETSKQQRIPIKRKTQNLLMKLAARRRKLLGAKGDKGDKGEVGEMRYQGPFDLTRARAFGYNLFDAVFYNIGLYRLVDFAGQGDMGDPTQGSAAFAKDPIATAYGVGVNSVFSETAAKQGCDNLGGNSCGGITKMQQTFDNTTQCSVNGFDTELISATPNPTTDVPNKEICTDRVIIPMADYAGSDYVFDTLTPIESAKAAGIQCLSYIKSNPSLLSGFNLAYSSTYEAIIVSKDMNSIEHLADAGATYDYPHWYGTDVDTGSGAVNRVYAPESPALGSCIVCNKQDYIASTTTYSDNDCTSPSDCETKCSSDSSCLGYVLDFDMGESQFHSYAFNRLPATDDGKHRTPLSGPNTLIDVTQSSAELTVFGNMASTKLQNGNVVTCFEKGVTTPFDQPQIYYSIYDMFGNIVGTETAVTTAAVDGNINRHCKLDNFTIGARSGFAITWQSNKYFTSDTEASTKFDVLVSMIDQDGTVLTDKFRVTEDKSFYKSAQQHSVTWEQNFGKTGGDPKNLIVNV